MYKAGFVLVLFLGVAQHAQAALPALEESSGWSVFSDPRYGTRVEYPSWFSVSDGRPELGTGKRLITPDRRAEIEIYSLSNSGHDSPTGYLAKKLHLSSTALHYKRVTKRFFVLSAIRDGKIRYTRCNFSGEAIHCVYLGYPPSEKRAWDDIVTRVSLSLRP